jgi:hypothetical protein
MHAEKTGELALLQFQISMAGVCWSPDSVELGAGFMFSSFKAVEGLGKILRTLEPDSERNLSYFLI